MPQSELKKDCGEQRKTEADPVFPRFVNFSENRSNYKPRLSPFYTTNSPKTLSSIQLLAVFSFFNLVFNFLDNSFVYKGLRLIFSLKKYFYNCII